MSVKSKIFDKNYYLNVCCGSEEFKKSKGKVLNPRVKKMLNKLSLEKYMDVLEIGCGRGDSALYISKKVNSVIGIDYSQEAINIANEIKLNYPQNSQSKVTFTVMNADNLKFRNNSFDYVLFIDTIDHLNKKELNKTMKEIRRVLKPEGKLFIRTCSNKLLLDYTYKFVIYPMDHLLTSVDKKIKDQNYNSLPKNSRTKEAKIQHINEPTYFSLKRLISKNHFEGKIHTEIGFIKEEKSLRSKFYNFITTLYPLSKHFPLNILFAHSFSLDLKIEKIK